MKNCKRIEFKKNAEKFLKSRPRKEQIRILSKIYKLPSGNHIKKWKGMIIGTILELATSA